jgi:hypothetical protein
MIDNQTLPSPLFFDILKLDKQVAALQLEKIYQEYKIEKLLIEIQSLKEKMKIMGVIR